MAERRSPSLPSSWQARMPLALYSWLASASPSVATMAVCTFCVGALMLSPRVQSFLVFVQIPNWPPFDNEDLGKASPAWIRRIAAAVGRVFWPGGSLRFNAFEGLPRAVPFSVNGSRGTVRGLHLPRAAPGHNTVLYLHGNGGNMVLQHRVDLYKLLASPPLCCDVYAIDYVGCGQSDRAWPDEASAVADTLATLEALPEDSKNVIIWGHSLGSGITVGALAELLRKGRALPRQAVLEAPFTSVPDVAASWLAWLPRPLFRRARALLHAALAAHRMPSLERLGPIAEKMRVDVLHGWKDLVVPYQHGQELANAAGTALHSFRRGHNDIVWDPELLPVLKKILAPPEAPEGGSSCRRRA